MAVAFMCVEWFLGIFYPPIYDLPIVVYTLYLNVIRAIVKVLEYMYRLKSIASKIDHTQTINKWNLTSHLA